MASLWAPSATYWPRSAGSEPSSTDAAVTLRVGRVVEDALRASPGSAVIIVSHFIAISHMLRVVMEIPAGAFSRVAFTIKNGGVHRLARRNDSAWWIEALNDCSHLSGLM